MDSIATPWGQAAREAISMIGLIRGRFSDYAAMRIVGYGLFLLLVFLASFVTMSRLVSLMIILSGLGSGRAVPMNGGERSATDRRVGQRQRCIGRVA
jgi:hypothetical protein